MPTAPTNGGTAETTPISSGEARPKSFAHAEQEAECVDEDVALAARDLLGRIKTLRVECRAPFALP